MVKSFISDITPFFGKRHIVYVDVGAHKGSTFESFARSDINIHQACLIEPNPKSFKVLENLCEQMQGIQTVDRYNMAVGGAEGTVMMHDADTMSRVVDAQPGGVSSGEFEVAVSTIDKLLTQVTDRHVDVLKIDVEGYELEVIKGAHLSLSEQAIDIIYIEAGLSRDRLQQAYYRDIEDALAQYEYRIFKIYEQKNEWLQDSPVLRRMNIAFMSSKFSAQNPMKLSRELYALQQKEQQLLARLSERDASNKPSRSEASQQEITVQSLLARFEAFERRFLDAADRRFEEFREERDELVRQLEARCDQLSLQNSTLIQEKVTLAASAEEALRTLEHQAAVNARERDDSQFQLNVLQSRLQSSEATRAELITEHKLATENCAGLESRITDFQARELKQSAENEVLEKSLERQNEAIKDFRLSSNRSILAILNAATPRIFLARHRMSWKIALLKRSNILDREWYLQTNPDVAQAGISPYRHFVEHGANEGRAPNKDR